MGNTQMTTWTIPTTTITTPSKTSANTLYMIIIIMFVWNWNFNKTVSYIDGFANSQVE